MTDELATQGRGAPASDVGKVITMKRTANSKMRPVTIVAKWPNSPSLQVKENAI